MMRPMLASRYLDAMLHGTGDDHAALRDLPALVEFAAVVRWGHLTQAAERLGVPQSTLSRRIARLEARLGFPLFIRQGRRLQPTPSARVFAAGVEHSLRELDRALDELVRDHDPSAGTVSLAFLHTLGAEVVPRLLREFRATHPQVRFQLAQDGHDEVVAKLRAGEVDLCLTSPLPEEAGLSSYALHRQRLCLAVPAGHPLGRANGIDLAVASGEAFIGFKTGYGLRRISDEWCARAGFTPILAFEGEDVATARGLVAAGLGVALLPASTGAVTPGVVEVSVEAPRAFRTIAMAWTGDHPLAPPVTAFRDFLLRRGPALVADDAETRAGCEGDR